MPGMERRIEALERLYSTPHEERYRLTEERKAAIFERIQRVIEEEERKGTPKALGGGNRREHAGAKAGAAGEGRL